MAIALALAAAPLVMSGTTLAAVSHAWFAGLCHQLPERSFVVDGHAMAVCHRCTAIYAGIGLGGLAVGGGMPVRASSRVGWAIALLALGGQVAIGFAFDGLDLAPLRFASGLVFGAWSGAAVASALGKAAAT